MEYGLFYETIAFPCGTREYSMPLGVVATDNLLWFRVFPGAGLSRLLSDSTSILLLAPRDPLWFAESLEHTLERRFQWSGGCPLIPGEDGLIIYCGKPLLEGSVGGVEYYSCRVSRIEGRGCHVYTRAYGCLVEFLIYYTRVLAGIIERDEFLERSVAKCIDSATRYGGWYRERFKRVLQRFLTALRET